MNKDDRDTLVIAFLIVITLAILIWFVMGEA